MLSYIGVDPGLSGAIAHLHEVEPSVWRLYMIDVPVLEISPTPKKVRRVVDLVTLNTELQALPKSQAMIERVSSMPGQGVSSTFRFGEAYGALQASIVCSGHRLWYTTPTSWKKDMKLGRDKEKARQVALSEFPACAKFFKRKKDHNRAEAALLALWKLRWDWELEVGEVLPCARNQRHAA